MTRSRYGWYVVAVLLVAYTLSFVDRTILTLLVEPIKRDLGLSDTQISLLHGLAFAIFYTALGIPIARLADRASRRNIIAIGIAIWSLMTAVCGVAKSFGQLFFARVGVGVGEAALSPAAYSMIADSFPEESLGRALGVYSSAIYAGAGIALLAGGAIAGAVAALPPREFAFLGTLYAWQLVFFIVGLPGLAVAAWVATLNEPMRIRRVNHEISSRAVMQHLGRHARAYSTHIGGFTLLAVVFNAYVAWMPSYLIRAFGWTIRDAAYALGLCMLVFGTSGIVMGGVSADRWRRAGVLDATIRVGIVSGVGLVPFTLSSTTLGSPWLSVACFAPLMFFSAYAFGAAVTGLQVITPSHLRAQVSAVFLFAVNLVGIGVGPTVVALLTDRVFADPLRVGESLAWIGTMCAISGAALLACGLRAFRLARES
jgi:MFS family permease